MAVVNNNVVDPNKKNTNTVNTVTGSATAGSTTNGNTVPGNTPAASNTGDYKGLGSIAHDGTAASLAAVEGAERDKVGSTNPDNYVAYTLDELKQLAASMGVDPSRLENNAARGFMSNDSNYVYSDRDIVEGGAGADEFWMNDGALDMIRVAQQNWGNATTQEERDYWHTVAEKIRATQGYSGGTDGTLYLTHGYLGVGDTANSVHGDRWNRNVYPAGNGSGSNTNGSGGNADPNSDLRGLLDAWQQAALKQSDGKVDYAVAKAVADLERALADAQPMFKEQAESVDRNARQAMDNSALYAEMRGDKGGIGQEQYNSIQNTAAQNHLAVQQAQTKLATDTQRQIADLRAQGEFEKADAALQITQQYLQQLIGLEQWAKEYNLSVDEFNASLKQWEAEYNLAMQQFETSKQQWAAEFGFQQQQYQNSLDQWQQEFDYNKQSDMANIGWALLEAGVPLSQEQMSAMGIDANQASQILMQAQLKAAGVGSTPTSGGGTLDYNGLFEAAKASGHPQSFIANNYEKYGFTSSTGLYNDYKSWTEQPVEPSLQDLDLVSVAELDLGAMLSYDEIERMVELGVLDPYESGDRIGVKWSKGWDAAKWRSSDLRNKTGGLLEIPGMR